MAIEKSPPPRRGRPSEREAAVGLRIDYDAVTNCLTRMDLLLRRRKEAQTHLGDLPADHPIFSGRASSARPAPSRTSPRRIPARRPDADLWERGNILKEIKRRTPIGTAPRWHLSHALLAPEKDESFRQYADRLRDIIRTVWERAEFLSQAEWRHGPKDLRKVKILWRGRRFLAWDLRTFFAWRRNDAPALPMPAEGWRTELDDREVDRWIDEVRGTPDSGARSRLLACLIVAYRWRLNLSPESVFDRIRARSRQRRQRGPSRSVSSR